MPISDAGLLLDLRTAHEAGDVDAARAIAKRIKAVRAENAAREKYDPSKGGGTMNIAGLEVNTPEWLDRGLAGAGAAANRLGNIFRSDEDVAEQKRLEEPLMATTAGKVGEFLGDTALGLAAGGAGTVAARAAPKLLQGGRAALAAATRGAPSATAAIAGNTLGGAGLGALTASPEDRLSEALSGGIMGGLGEVGGRALGRVVAPYRSKGSLKGLNGEQSVLPLGNEGQIAQHAADKAVLEQTLGKDIVENLPLSSQLPGTSGQGALRAEIGLRNLPVFGGVLKGKDEALREAYVKHLFKETGTDIGEHSVGPRAFQLMDETLDTNAKRLERQLAEGGNLARSDIVDEMRGIQRRLGDDTLPGERAAAATQAADKEGIANLLMNERAKISPSPPAYFRQALEEAEQEARVKAVGARANYGAGSPQQKAAQKAWDEARQALREVKPDINLVNTADDAVTKALSERQAARATVEQLQQKTGWNEFDKLIETSLRPDKLTGADVNELRKRANALFQSVRENPATENAAAKLDAIRQFKDTLNSAADRVLGGTSDGAFTKLSRQEGMASTLRNARDSAGKGAFSPEAIAKELETVFGAKTAAAEKLPSQKLAGALERMALGSFAAGPEQYKALVAGTLMGKGVFPNLRGAIASPLAALAIGSTPGRKLLDAAPWRVSLAKALEKSVAGMGAGRANVFDL